MLKKPLRVDEYRMCIVDPDGLPVGGCMLRSEAVEIVTAVNCHDDLLAACEAMLDGLDDYWIASDDGQRVFKMAKAAISKARPEPAKEQ